MAFPVTHAVHQEENVLYRRFTSTLASNLAHASSIPHLNGQFAMEDPRIRPADRAKTQDLLVDDGRDRNQNQSATHFMKRGQDLALAIRELAPPLTRPPPAFGRFNAAFIRDQLMQISLVGEAFPGAETALPNVVLRIMDVASQLQRLIGSIDGQLTVSAQAILEPGALRVFVEKRNALRAEIEGAVSALDQAAELLSPYLDLQARRLLPVKQQPPPVRIVTRVLNAIGRRR
jgi:hypothetical protein